MHSEVHPGGFYDIAFHPAPTLDHRQVPTTGDPIVSLVPTNETFTNTDVGQKATSAADVCCQGTMSLLREPGPRSSSLREIKINILNMIFHA